MFIKLQRQKSYKTIWLGWSTIHKIEWYKAGARVYTWDTHYDVIERPDEVTNLINKCRTY
jgi:hypothetical protein